MASEKTGFCGEAISPGSRIRVRTTASVGATSCGIGELLFQEGELSSLACKLRFGLRDVFLAWPCDGQVQHLPVEREPSLALGNILPARTEHGQVQGLLVDGQLRFGLIEGGLRIIEVLLADG